MKVSLTWLKELIDFNLTPQELADQLSLRSIGVKTVTNDYIELDLTYNRGDLLSLRGVARELAAITQSKIKFDSEIEYIWEGRDLPKVKVEVQDSKLCPLYCVAKIEGLKIDRSPSEWTKKLSDSGIRSIDTITDITNLMMLEFGQTMHAFDANKVSGETMIIRLAKDGEQFATLDGKVRKLTKDDLLITDPAGILSLSGIMGGKNSEITEKTNTILLEVAIFDPVSIRGSSQRFGLHSEASKRIQHGLTKTNLLQALNAAIKIYEGLGGKMVGLSVVGNLEEKPTTIQLTQQKINSLLGVKIPAGQVELSLKSLGFELASQGDAWEARVPYWRLDINIEEDLIEEVARMYGYEKIAGTPLPQENIPALDQTLPKFIYNLKVKLKDLGLTEVQTYSFYSTAILEALAVPKQALVKIANPISAETEYMRNDLWPNLVEVVGKNIRQGFKDIAVFEIGKVYWQEDGQPTETYRLAIALMNGSDNPLEELAGLVESLNVHPVGRLAHVLDVHLNPALFHPNRIKDGMGEVHLRILNKLGIEKRVAVIEFQL